MSERSTTGALRRRGVGVLIGVSVLLAPTAAGAYTVESGETLSQIALRHRVSTAALAQANGIADPNRIVAGTTLTIPGQGGAVSHVVRPGETLSGIAAQYGISVRALAEANGISDPDRIYHGTSLSLQGGASGSGTSGGGAAAPATTTARSADRDAVRRMIVDAASRQGWRPAIPLGLAMQESGWNNAVVSSAGAIGIFQVLPATGEWVGTYLLNRPLDLQDPADNIAAGMAYLDYLYNRFDGDVEMAVAAYFEGPQRTERAGAPSTPGAQRYVDNVLALADRYR